MFLLLPVVGLVRMVWIRFTDRDQWEWLSDREAPLPGMSRADLLVYSSFGLMITGAVATTLFRTTEVSEMTASNTKEMGEVVAQMQKSTDQSLALLAAMRSEADSARKETAAAQKLALWVGILTAVVGAMIGGVAGAVAAQALP